MVGYLTRHGKYMPQDDDCHLTSNSIRFDCSKLKLHQQKTTRDVQLALDYFLSVISNGDNPLLNELRQTGIKLATYAYKMASVMAATKNTQNSLFMNVFGCFMNVIVASVQRKNNLTTKLFNVNKFVCTFCGKMEILFNKVTQLINKHSQSISSLIDWLELHYSQEMVSTMSDLYKKYEKNASKITLHYNTICETIDTWNSIQEPETITNAQAGNKKRKSMFDNPIKVTEMDECGARTLMFMSTQKYVQ